MIYAVRTTERGRSFLHTEEIYTLTPQRVTILLASVPKKKEWFEWKIINQAIQTLVDECEDTELKRQLQIYANNTSRIVSDVLFLEGQQLIEAARYRAPNQQFYAEKPYGMIHR